MRRIVAVIVALIAAVAVASPASANTSDQQYVKRIIVTWFYQATYEDQSTICDWFLYDRADFYRQSYREIWAEDDVSYYDMRVGLYRGLKPLC